MLTNGEIEPNPYASPVHVDATAPIDWLSGNLFGRAGRIYFGHWPQFSAVLFFVWWPIEALMGFLEEDVLNSDAMFDWILFMSLDFGLESLPEAIVLCLLSSAVLGQSVELPQAFRQGISIWFWLTWTNFIASVLISLGMILLIVPGLFLGIKFLFTDAIVVHERIYGAAAMRRSFDLTTGHFVPLFGLAVFMGAVIVGGSVVVELIPTPLSNWPLWIWESLLRSVEAGAAIYPTICLFLYYCRVSNDAGELRHTGEVIREPSVS